jgi:hypothetical protein
VDDPIAEKLHQKWKPHLLDENDKDKIREWLSQQELSDIELYLDAFADELSPIRALLLREEVKRREKPPPDQAARIIAKIKSNRIIASVSVMLVLLATAAGTRSRICDGFPEITYFCAASESRTKLEQCLLEPSCRVAVHLATQSLDRKKFKPKPGVVGFDVKACDNARSKNQTIRTSQTLTAYASKSPLQDRELRRCVVSGDMSCEGVVSLERSKKYTLSDCTRFSNFGSYQFIGFIEE